MTSYFMKVKQKEVSLQLARSIIYSFVVNIKQHPEFAEINEDWITYCERNFKVWNAICAIDELIKSL